MEKEVYKAVPVVENPLLDTISPEALIAWFRCNSCPTCAFRAEVVDKVPSLDIQKCSEMHVRWNIVDMVEVLGYSKE